LILSDFAEIEAMGEGRHTCRVLSTCCVLCCCLLGCADAAADLPIKDKDSSVLVLFQKYGNGTFIDYNGLEKLLADLHIPNHKDGNHLNTSQI